jgi:hypothetical protein
MEAYDVSQDEAVQQALEMSPIGGPLLKLAHSLKKGQTWEGTAETMLAELESLSGDSHAPGFPGAPHVLSRELKRLEAPLRDVGIRVWQQREGKKGSRIWRLSVEEAESEGNE